MQLVSSAGLVATSARSLAPMKLYQPHSVAETLAALDAAENPLLLAGGTDLVACFNEGLGPREIVDLARVQELRGIEADSHLLDIGAGVTHGIGCAHAAVLARAPGFAQAWGRIANPRIRFGATLGGNLMARRARYEGPVLLAALAAALVFTGAAGTQSMTVADLWATRVPARSLLTRIRIDTGALLWYSYERSMRPLITLAASLTRSADGMRLRCAVATEYLQPTVLELALPATDLAQVALAARTIARDAFAQLPASFADPVVTHSYAVAAGTALLSRQLAGAPHG